MLELAFRVDRSRREPVYRQLEGYLRELVQTGRLAAGERLPASRELAASLGLARNTVNQAYQTLVDEGLLRAHVGQGTFVVGRLGVAPAPDEGDAARRFAWDGLLARRTRALPLPQGAGRDPETIRFDFRGGRVDPGSLPTAELRRVFSRAAAEVASLSDAIDPRGWKPLRRLIARALVARGIECGAHEVAVVNGAQQALDLVARTLVDPGDTVAIEQPGYFGAALAFASCEAHLVGVGVDEQGLCTDELARVLRARRVKLLYTTPAVQHPTGVALSDARRQALLELSDAYQLPIVEDDYDGELRYGGPPVPALKNLDRAGRVVYVGTFSKALFPGLRLGYLVAPPPLLTRLAIARFGSDFSSDVVVQAAVARLLEGGGLERHVRRVRKLYTARRERLLGALEAHMPEGTRWQPPAGGNAVWVRLPDGVDPAEVQRCAHEAGIAYAAGATTVLPSSAAFEEANRHLALCFARLDAAGLDEGVAALADAVKRARSKKRSAA